MIKAIAQADADACHGFEVVGEMPVELCPQAHAECVVAAVHAPADQQRSVEELDTATLGAMGEILLGHPGPLDGGRWFG